MENPVSKTETQENPVASKAVNSTTGSKHNASASDTNVGNDNMSGIRGKKTLTYQPASVGEILSTSSPRLPSMQLPPWQPRSQPSFSSENETLYNQPKPIIGNAPSKSYSQSRPRFNQSSNSAEEPAKSSNSLPEIKDDLQDKLQKMNTNVSLYTSKVYRPSKMYTHPRTHPVNKSPAILTPPEEMFNFPSQSPPHGDSASTVLTSDLSAEASSSHDSLLGHERNNSIDTSSLTRSSTSSCDSYIRTDFSRTDVDSPSPAFYDYNQSINWVYPENVKNNSKLSETNQQNSCHNILLDGKQLLPEVGLSPSRNVLNHNSYNVAESAKDLNYGDKSLNKKNGQSNKSDSDSHCNKSKKSNASQQTDASALLRFPQKNYKKKQIENLYGKKESLCSENPHSHYYHENIPNFHNGISDRHSSSDSDDKKIDSSKPMSQNAFDSKISQNIPLQELNIHDSDTLSEVSKKYKCRKSAVPLNSHKYCDNNNSSGSERSSPKADMICHSNSSDKMMNISSDKYSKSVEAGEASSTHFDKSRLTFKFPSSSELKESDDENLSLLKEGSGRIVPTSSGQSSDSDESDDEKSAEAPLIDEYCTDDPTLENASLLNEHGLTDAEGALSDLNSIINDPGPVDGDMDDTSISSRASSRMFDSDQLLSVDSLNVMYDSEYDNYRPGMISDEDIFHPDHASDADLDYMEDPHIENIRVLSNNITKNFGQSSRGENDDSELG